MRSVINILFVVVFVFPLTAQETDVIDPIQKLINDREYAKARNMVMPKYNEDDEDPQANYFMAQLALVDTLYDDAIDYMDVAIETDENNHH